MTSTYTSTTYPSASDRLGGPIVSSPLSSDDSSLLAFWNPKRGAIAEKLVRNPQSFDFFQALLVLERLAANATTVADKVCAGRIGEFRRPDSEPVRLSAPATSTFPTAQIDSLELDKDLKPRMVVNFMGLTGPSGILPRTYTTLLAQVIRDGRGDERYALRDFLDQFNHRLLSLFYVAWTKYRFPVCVLRNGRRNTIFDVALHSVAGLCRREPVESASDSREYLDDLIGFAGLLSQQPATAGNLQAILERCLGVPIKVLQFQPSDLELDEFSQCRLGIENGCGQLGINSVVGPRTRSRQHKIRIQVGPISVDQFQLFLPGAEERSTAYTKLCEIVRVVAGHAIEFDLRILVRSQALAGCRIESFDNETEFGSRLGFDSWLASDEWPEVLDDAIIPESEVGSGRFT